MCEILIMRNYLVLPWKFLTLRSLCLPNVQYLIVKKNRLFLVLSSVRRFCQFADRIGQVANISRSRSSTCGCMRTCQRFIGNPVIIIISPLLALMHDQDEVKKLSSLGFKAAFVGPERAGSKNFAGHRARELYICLPFSRVCTYNGKVTKYAQKWNLSGTFDRLWMKSIVLPNGALQTTTRIVQLFVCGIFVIVAILLCHFNVGIFTSSVWNFWPRIADVSLRVFHVVARANERGLYSQAIACL